MYIMVAIFMVFVQICLIRDLWLILNRQHIILMDSVLYLIWKVILLVVSIVIKLQRLLLVAELIIGQKEWKIFGFFIREFNSPIGVVIEVWIIKVLIDCIVTVKGVAVTKYGDNTRCCVKRWILSRDWRVIYEAVETLSGFHWNEIDLDTVSGISYRLFNHFLNDSS
uniref:Uncharacterized protein n=1 Tax=Cacopsylla melanoneura TaxID=428564 RepID=A0A8D9E7G5_9HEMI